MSKVEQNKALQAAQLRAVSLAAMYNTEKQRTLDLMTVNSELRRQLALARRPWWRKAWDATRRKGKVCK